MIKLEKARSKKHILSGVLLIGLLYLLMVGSVYASAPSASLLALTPSPEPTFTPTPTPTPPPPVPIPEPATIILVGSGLAALSGLAARKRKANSDS